MDVIIYHNPACGTSRNVLDLIRKASFEPHVVKYLKRAPSQLFLMQRICRMGISALALLREKGSPFTNWGLAILRSPTTRCATLFAHPILIKAGREIVPSFRGHDMLPARLPKPGFRQPDQLG